MKHCMFLISRYHNITNLKAEVLCSFITMTLLEQNPRSHHKGATGRVQTGNQLYPVLGYCQLGQDIQDKFTMSL